MKSMMVNFKLGDKCDKDEIINMTVVRVVWDKEKNLSPRRESNPWPPEHRVGALSTELRMLMES